MIRLRDFAPVDEDRVGHHLSAEQDVLSHRQHRDQHEVLVNHANSAGDGIRGIGDLDRFSIEQDFAFIRAGQSVENIHERRLARAVFAKQGVDLPGLHIQIDMVVGDDTREALGDSAHLEPWRRGLFDAHMQVLDKV